MSSVLSEFGFWKKKKFRIKEPLVPVISRTQCTIQLSWENWQRYADAWAAVFFPPQWWLYIDPNWNLENKIIIQHWNVDELAMVLQNTYVPQHHRSALGSSKISECEWLIRMATNSSYFRKFPAKTQYFPIQIKVTCFMSSNGNSTME